MDIIDHDETTLVNRHKKLLADQGTQRVNVKRSEEQLSRTREFSQQCLKINSELLTVDLYAESAKSRSNLVKEVFQTAPVELQEKSGLKALLEDLTAKLNTVIAKTRRSRFDSVIVRTWNLN